MSTQYLLFAMTLTACSTEVGKTIISAGLSLAALNDTRKVCYLKPVQTGELDEYFIQLYTNPRGINDIFVRTLQHWSSREFPYRRHQDEQAEEVSAAYLPSLPSDGPCRRSSAIRSC